jgi:LPS-assembly lipoprotein
MNRPASRWLLMLLAGLAVSACGFQLRSEARLPEEMSATQMVVDDENSTLARRVRTMLEQSGVRFTNGAEATAVLEIPTNRVVTEVLTIGDNARVKEYRITHTVRFRLTDTDGRELLPMQTLRQAREISFDEQKILAASREQEYLEKDLAETLARLMVTRLESADPGPG